MPIDSFIKHGPHCLAGKYSTMGRCSCGAQEAMEELAALRKAAQHRVHVDFAYCTCKVFMPSGESTLPVCRSCGKPQSQ